MSTQPISPVTYPVVAIGGKPYELRFTTASMFLLERWGVNPAKFDGWYKHGLANSPNDTIQHLVAAMAGTVDGATGDFIPLGIPPLQLAARMKAPEWAAVVKAYAEGMVKAAPAAEAPPQAPPATKTGPIQ